MSTSDAPAEVVRAVCAGVSRLVGGGLDQGQREAQLDELAARYAEQTDVSHPLAPGGAPALRTRADLRRHFDQASAGFTGVERFEPVGVQVHQTADPEVVVIEFRYEGTVGGRPLSITNANVTRVRDGLIIESRDYVDHIAAARAFGHLPALAAALAGAEPA
jgi:ketosteroid isomerase-like protein